MESGSQASPLVAVVPFCTAITAIHTATQVLLVFTLKSEDHIYVCAVSCLSIVVWCVYVNPAIQPFLCCPFLKEADLRW